MSKRQERCGRLFEDMKYLEPDEIANILTKGYNERILTIAENPLKEEESDRCLVAFIIAIGMLKNAHAKLKDEEAVKGNT